MTWESADAVEEPLPTSENVGDGIGRLSGTVTLAPARRADKRQLRLVLPERDWADALQERHRYRGWVWPGGRASAVRVARQVTSEALSDWRLGPMTDDVVVCVSELMTNALMHARVSTERLRPYQVVLGLRYFPGSCLFIEVGDCDPQAPTLPEAHAHDDPSQPLMVGGRGLEIVRALADDVWWKRRGTGGKYMYARLNTPRFFGADEAADDD